jgi:hypothetical protein
VLGAYSVQFTKCVNVEVTSAFLVSLLGWTDTEEG